MRSDVLLLSMSMAWDYVSELPPPTGIVFIPEVIYDWGGPRWNGIDRENSRNRRKPVPVSLCPKLIPRGQTRARTRASAVRGRRIIAWSMARSCVKMLPRHFRGEAEETSEIFSSESSSSARKPTQNFGTQISFSLFYEAFSVIKTK
jgi:hypothetical protein